MILRYATNLKLAKELYDASKAAAAGLFAASFLNKNISRLGSLAAISVLGVAAYKHFEAGHGKKGAQHALDLLGLSTLSLLDTFSCKK